jgi:pilus assembly protein Flp/PilA
MNSIVGKIRLFKKDEKGVTMLEYGLIAVLVAVAAIGGATTLGGNLNTTFTDIAKKILY